MRPCFQRTMHVLVSFVSIQNNDACTGESLADLKRGLNAPKPGHSHVHYYDIRPVLATFDDCASSGARLVNNRPNGLRADDGPYSLYE